VGHGIIVSGGKITLPIYAIKRYRISLLKVNPNRSEGRKGGGGAGTPQGEGTRPNERGK